MSSCDPCTGVGPNGAPGGGGGGGTVTLQAALDGQDALGVPTTQAYDTTIDIDTTNAWIWRDSGANEIFRINSDGAADAIVVTGGENAGVGQNIRVTAGSGAGAGDAAGSIFLAAGTPGAGGTPGVVAVTTAFAITGDISPAALAAGATNDYAPAGIGSATTLRLTPNAAGSTLTGITTGSDGRVLVIMNIGTAADITLLHDDGASSAAANRFLCPANASLVIPANGSVVVEYDSTSSRWRVVSVNRTSALFIVPPFSQVGATVGTVNLGVVTNPGDRIVIRGLTISAIFTAGIAAGDVGQIAYAGAVQAQNATTDAQVVVFGPQPWGPPPVAALQPTSTGYQPGPAFGSPGGIGVVINVAGTTLRIQCTGIAGFTTQFDIIGEIYLYGTSTRIVA